MKTIYFIKYCLLLICVICIGSSQAYEENSLTIASAQLREKEKLAKQADMNLTQDVKDAFVNANLFGKDKFVDMGLRVTAKKGIVTLSGRVESEENVKEAIELAKSVEGVKSVYSKMVVKLIKQPPLTDDLLAQNVKDKFVREKLFGKNKFEEMGIQVTAVKGVITLTGDVGSNADAQKIMTLTKGIYGVKNVESKIVIHKVKN